MQKTGLAHDRGDTKDAEEKDDSKTSILCPGLGLPGHAQKKKKKKKEEKKERGGGRGWGGGGGGERERTRPRKLYFIRTVV